MIAEQPKKRKNRTRCIDAINQRNFQCSCGRKYLSYSALYTHSKQKHGITISTKNIDFLNPKNQSNSANKRKQEEQTRKGLYIDLQKAQTNQNYGSNRGKNKNFPLSVSKTEKLVSIQKSLIQFVSKEDQFWDSTERVYVNDVLACLVAYMNSNYSLVEISFRNSSMYCESRTPAYLPLFFNSFFKEELPKNFNLQDQFVKKTVIKILSHLGQWLYLNRYTLLQTKMTEDEGLEE